MAGWFLCIGPAAYWGLPSITIPAGGYVVVHWNESGEHAATEIYTGPKAGLGDADGELALFQNNSGFSNGANIRDYVQWGAANHTREAAALSGGIWTNDQFVSVGGLSAGSSIAYDGGGDQASDWTVDATPTMGAAN